jgi:hypothetical protein
MRIISIYDSTTLPFYSACVQQKEAGSGSNIPAAYEVTQTNRLRSPPSSDRIYIVMIMILILDETAIAGLSTSNRVQQ